MNKEEFQEALGRIGRVSRTVRRHYQDPSVIEEITVNNYQNDEFGIGFNGPNNHYGKLDLSEHDRLQYNYRPPQTPGQPINTIGMVTSRPVYRNPLMKFSPVKSIQDLTSPKNLFKKAKRIVKRQKCVNIQKLEENLSNFKGLFSESVMSKILQAAYRETPGHPLQSLVQPNETTSPYRKANLYKPISSNATNISSQAENPQNTIGYLPESQVPYGDLDAVSVGLDLQGPIKMGTPGLRTPLFCPPVVGMQTPSKIPFTTQSVPSTQRRVTFEEQFQMPSIFSLDGIELKPASPVCNTNESYLQLF